MLYDRVPVRGNSFRSVKTMPEARVGVDAGGTFTDVVVLDAGVVHSFKLPTDAGLGEGLSRARRIVAGIPTVVAGTTWVTNAVLEKKLARTALVTTEGFADVLEIGRQARDDLYDLHRPARVPPPVPRQLCFEAAERIGPDGAPRIALSNEETERVAAAVRAAGVRASTTALNAAVMPVIDRYLRAQEKAVAGSFAGAPSFIVHSGGGMMTVERARLLPLATVMSGPAAGVAATARLARRFGLAHAVSVDMGGTSTDVCLLRDGIPVSARDRRLGGHVVRLPAVAVESIGAGGGSIAWVDDVGALRIGPHSAGAVPGPAAYGRGGVEATVTDADVVLGLAGLVGGGLELDKELALEACAHLGARLGLSAEEAARATVDVAHAEIERALRLVTVRRGHDLRACTLVAYGGAGPMHVGAVALAAGVERVLVPANSSTFSALGCCLSELVIDEVRTCLAPVDETNWPRVERELESLAGELAAGLESGHGVLRIACSLELRYHDQNDALEVAVDGASSPAAVRAAFHERHRSEFGYATEEQVEVTATRVRVWVDEGTSWVGSAPAERGDTELGETVFGPVLRRGAFERVEGPAVLADTLSTIVVWPGQTARTDEDGNVWLERA